jgi:hypothetical protein
VHVRVGCAPGADRWTPRLGPVTFRRGGSTGVVDAAGLRPKRVEAESGGLCVSNIASLPVLRLAQQHARTVLKPTNDRTSNDRKIAGTQAA